MKRKRMTWAQVKKRLRDGKPSARLRAAVMDGRLVVEYLPRVGGVWVLTGSGDRFSTAAEAMCAAKRFQVEYRRSGSVDAANRA
jgi:hypothetical protein